MAAFIDPDYGTKAVTATITAPVPVAAAGGTLPKGIPMLVSQILAITSPAVDRGSYRGPAAVVITNVGTGSPSETVDLQGSVDGVNYYNIGYSLVATPNTVVVTQITITSSATTTYLLATDQSWRFFRIVTAAVTTQTTWATYYQ